MKERLGVSTGIAYQHPIGVVLEPIRRAGFSVIEVATAPGHVELGNGEWLGRLARQIADLGLEVHSLHAPFAHDVDLTDSDHGVRQRSFELLTRAADALHTLGGKLYVIHPGGEDHHWIWEREARLARSVEGLTELWQVCQERGLIMVVETPLPHLLGGQLDDLDWILARLPGEGTGVCVDTSHCSLGGFLFEAIERFASRLVHIQASDNRGVTDDHLPPGDGIIDWPRVLSTLERAAYRGLVLLEVAGDGDITAHVERLAVRARATLPGLELSSGVLQDGEG